MKTLFLDTIEVNKNYKNEIKTQSSLFIGKLSAKFTNMIQWKIRALIQRLIWCLDSINVLDYIIVSIGMTSSSPSLMGCMGLITVKTTCLHKAHLMCRLPMSTNSIKYGHNKALYPHIAFSMGNISQQTTLPQIRLWDDFTSRQQSSFHD